MQAPLDGGGLRLTGGVVASWACDGGAGRLAESVVAGRVGCGVSIRVVQPATASVATTRPSARLLQVMVET